MTVADEMLQANEDYAAGFGGYRPSPPARQVAVVACMDARLDVYRALGLSEGEAHVVRNAGGVVTDDVLRSLTISQRLLGTREVVLVHHTDCGMMTFTDEQFAQRLRDETGEEPSWRAHAFTDLDDDVRDGMRRLRESVFVGETDQVRGFVLDVGTGRLHEVA